LKDIPSCNIADVSERAIVLIDHIGVVVSSIEDGIRQWREMFGYLPASDVVENTSQKVRVVFLAKECSTLVKLVEPSCAESPVSAFARKGGGLHHLCFRCNDLDVEIPLLRQQGARFIVPPEPGEAFNGEDIAFFLAGNNLSVELIDTPHKATFRAMTV
jgi:methylmalonyl-CoA/ethylmalonyl-CoA epimerase